MALDDTADNTAEDTEAPNFFDMSDDEFMKLPDPSVKVEEDTADTEDDEEEETEEESAETIEKSAETTEDKEEVEDDEEEESDISSDTGDTDNDTSTDEDDDAEVDDDSTDTDIDADDSNSDTDESGYVEEYKKLLAPFKANGSQLQVKSTDEIISLMQMGANYHKKMAGLKPSLKIVKTLEKSGLLDEDKINYLIDLHNKTPEAIQKLLKDSKIDPMDIDVTAEETYKPTKRQVTDNELELDNVLESIKDTPTYDRTLTVLTDNWDDTSRTSISANPHIISVINGHMGDGTFDVINEVMTRERSFGKLQGMSDFDAYKAIGDALHAKGQLPGQTADKPAPRVTTKKVTKNKAEVKKRKKAISPNTTRKSTDAPAYNPLAMSDEEFLKISDKHLT